VHPYQPAGYYKELNFPKREYEAEVLRGLEWTPRLHGGVPAP
jgi:hypothetical protein